MSKYVPIRWTKSQKARLKRTLKNYNARVRRARAANPANAQYLPETVTYKQATENILTARDLNYYIKSLENFTAKTAEIITNKHGVKTSIWQANEIKRKVNRENRRRKRAEEEKRKKQKTYVGGKEIPSTPMTTNVENRPLQADFSTVQNQSNFKELVNYLNRLTDKKRGMTDPAQYFTNIEKALNTLGITDILIKSMYFVISEDLKHKYDEGHPAADLTFIYDDENTTQEDRETEIKLDLAQIIRDENKQKEIFETVYFQVDSETREMWEIIGYEKLFEFAVDDVNVRNKKEILNIINDDSKLKKKYNKMIKQKSSE